MKKYTNLQIKNYYGTILRKNNTLKTWELWGGDGAYLSLLMLKQKGIAEHELKLMSRGKNKRVVPVYLLRVECET